MPGDRPFRTNLWIYLGLFLLSSAVLHIEMVQMRIFSLALWHHLAYLVVTFALLGFGASGTLIAVFPSVFTRNIYRTLVVSCLVFAGATVGAFWAISCARLDTFKLLSPAGISYSELTLLFGYYSAFVVPFIAAGAAVAVLFSVSPSRSYGLYFMNLTGSAAGVVFFSMAIGRLGGELSIVAGCVLAALAALCFSIPSNSRSAVTGSSGMVIVLMGLGVCCPSVLKPIPASSKAYGMYLDRFEDFEVLYSEWNPISRIDVISSRRLMLPWLPEDGSYPPHLAITIDGDATTWMWNMGLAPEDVCGIEDDLYASAYHTKRNPDVLVIGLGGGNDVRTALHYNAGRIVGVEINPLIVDLLLNRFTDFIDNICYHPGVEIFVAEGRSFARRTRDKFDIIQMSGVDTWSGLSSGSYVLSENYLYTLEAFGDYFGCLKPGGILSVNRWVFDPPREMLRMVAVGAESMRRQGIPDPWNHILVMSTSHFCSTLFKTTPWTAKEIATYNWYTRQRDDFIIRYTPGSRLDNPFNALMQAFRKGTEREFYDDYLYDIEPVTDDNPFFFDYYKWRFLPRQIFSSGTGGQIGANWPIAMVLLLAMLAQTGFLVLVFIFLPLSHFQNRGLGIPHAPRLIGYFSCLGIGYIFVEIVFMQKLVLYLGHPIYSISVVLSGLLFFSGLGSLLASVMPYWKSHFLTVILALVSTFIVLECAVMPSVIESTLQDPLPIRILISLCMIAPVACLMGIPFPTGLKIARQSGSGMIPWAWGANGGSTVLGSVGSIILAMNLGFSFVLLTGACMYLVAMILVFRFKKIPA